MAENDFLDISYPRDSLLWNLQGAQLELFLRGDGFSKEALD